VSLLLPADDGSFSPLGKVLAGIRTAAGQNRFKGATGRDLSAFGNVPET
jgi:hypothetical protein